MNWSFEDGCLGDRCYATVIMALSQTQQAVGKVESRSNGKERQNPEMTFVQLQFDGLHTYVPILEIYISMNTSTIRCLFTTLILDVYTI
jgi:hypothetical protein